MRFKSQYLRSLNVFACNFLPFKIKLCRQVFRVGSIILMTHNNHLNPKLVSLPIIRSLISTIPTQLHWSIHKYIFYIYKTLQCFGIANATINRGLISGQNYQSLGVLLPYLQLRHKWHRRNPWFFVTYFHCH